MRPAIVVATLLLLSSCRSAEMAVPPALADSAEPMAVSGANPRRWGGELSFGPYRTAEVEDGTEFSWLVRPGSVGVGRATRPYRFAIVGPEGSVTAECRTQRWELVRGSFSVDLGLGAQPVLVCGFETEADARWTLAVTERAPNFDGVVRGVAGGSEWQVRSIRRFEGSSWQSDEPVGWEITDDVGAVGAVETVNRGRVWFAPRLDPADRELAAATSAALLLFTSPEVVTE